MRRKETIHISEIIPDILKHQNIATKLDETTIINGWQSIVGSFMAEYTKSAYIRDGVLYVEITSSVARGELSMNRNILINKLNNLTGRRTISNIVFR